MSQGNDAVAVPLRFMRLVDPIRWGRPVWTSLRKSVAGLVAAQLIMKYSSEKPETFNQNFSTLQH